MRLPAGAITPFLGIALFMTEVSGCAGGGGETDAPAARQLTTEEYFQELEASFERLEARVADSSDAAEPDSASGPQALLDYLHDSLIALEESVSAFHDEVQALGPPGVAETAHEEFVEAVESDRESIARIAEEVADADTVVEALSAFEDRGSTLAKSREPCQKLEQIAGDNRVSVNLPCEE